MTKGRRWDPCISHVGSAAEDFVEAYAASPGRQILLVAGAGFDPRAGRVARVVSRATSTARGLFIKEHRPNKTLDQEARAKANAQALTSALPNSEVVPVDVFEDENAIVGGRNVITVLEKEDLDRYTDVIVDVSAMSVGMSFPVIRYLWERNLAVNSRWNLHLLVTHDPSVDVAVRSTPGDTIAYMKGFKGGITLSGVGDVPRLWLPQLARGRVNSLRRLYGFLNPHDVCPVIPFPASNPRLGDEIIEEYRVELEDMWSVDVRNFVYASEADPLDLYRTVLKLDDRRQPVFHEIGGNLLVLSVVGSKLMALGALMAALERDLPVLHVEPSGYDLVGDPPLCKDDGALIHIWLEGEAYPQPRPARMVRGT